MSTPSGITYSGGSPAGAGGGGGMNVGNVTVNNPGDPWSNLSTYACATCRFFVPKDPSNGRCRRHAPTMEGYPVVYIQDWCGDHKLGTNPSRS